MVSAWARNRDPNSSLVHSLWPLASIQLLKAVLELGRDHTGGTVSDEEVIPKPKDPISLLAPRSRIRLDAGW